MRVRQMRGRASHAAGWKNALFPTGETAGASLPLTLCHWRGRATGMRGCLIGHPGFGGIGPLPPVKAVAHGTAHPCVLPARAGAGKSQWPPTHIVAWGGGSTRSPQYPPIKRWLPPPLVRVRPMANRTVPHRPPRTHHLAPLALATAAS